MKRRKKPTLPRLSVLSMNSKELARFVLAVEQLPRLVEQMEELVDALSAKRPRRKPVDPFTGLPDTTHA